MLQLARKVVILVISVGVLWATGSLFAQPASAACSINRFGECGGTCSGGTCKTQGSVCVCVYSPPPPSCPSSCLNGCYSGTSTCRPYCSNSCTYGCSSQSSSGGTCNPPPCDNSCPTYCGFGGGRNDCNNWCSATPACTYCSSSCPNGCSSLSSTGGTCNPYCKTCPSGQSCTNPSSTGGTCLPTCVQQCINSCITDATRQCDINTSGTPPYTCDSTKSSSCGNNIVKCDYYVPGTDPLIKYVKDPPNCTLPSGVTNESSSLCVKNTTCTTGLCHPSKTTDVLCGTWGAYNDCLNQYYKCVDCGGNPKPADNPQECSSKNPAQCGIKSGYDYGILCPAGTIPNSCSGRYAGAICSPISACGNENCQANLGEDCSTCSADCGVCPPGGPGGTPPPPPPPPPPPGTTGWWQVKDGGANAAGNVRSDADANGGTLVDKTGVPAVVSCGGTTCSPAGDPKSWDVVSTISSAALADNSYAEFKRRVGNKVTPQAYSGLLTTGYWQVGASGTSLGGPVGDNVVVILSEGPVTITSNITLGSQGLLVVIAKGDISINPTVNNIQGLFLTDGTFKTGDSATPLVIDGSVAALTGVTLQRTTTGATPAELFVHHPEYLARIPAPVLNRNQFKSEEHP